MAKDTLLTSAAPASLIREPSAPVNASSPKHTHSRPHAQQPRHRPQQARQRQHAGSAGDSVGDDGGDSDDDGGGDGGSRDQFVPDPLIAKEFHVSLMTLWRWAHDAELRFPPAVKINSRNYRSRRMIEQWKARMLRRAIAHHAEAAAAVDGETK